MCGIVGTFRFDGRPIDRGALERQIGLIRHRGPDAQASWVDGPIGLGHARLSIIDLSPAGSQPMHTADGGRVLIFNGEIYNFPTLRRELEGHYSFRGHSDTEVLLYAFARWGADSLTKLVGQFAFALFERGSRALWLARDAFGIKPLYYHCNENRIVFSSEIKPLFLDPETPREPDHDALRQHLLLGYAVDPQTAFKGIFRLPPGHCMRIGPDGARAVRKFWSVEQCFDHPAGDLLSTLRESSALHSISDAPEGILLSGGLDSSMLLSCFSRLDPQPPGFKAYNVGLEPDDPMDAPSNKLERSTAVRTCAHFDVPLVKIDARAPETVSLADIAYSVEEPICNPSNAMIDLICARARADGIKVLISGHGGDEIFAGYRRHVWARYMPPLRRGGLAFLGGLAARCTNDPIIRRMAASLHRANPVSPLVSVAASGWDLVTRHAISPSWFAAPAIPATVQPLMDMLERWKSMSFLKQMMLLDIHTYLTAQNLINMDKSSMRRSVEVRVPFLYRPLLSIGLQTPDSRLVRGLRNKVPIRRVARETLPRFLLHVPKIGFGPPYVPIVTSEAGRDLLLGSRTAARGMFDPAAIRKMFGMLKPKSDNLAMQLYTVMMIEQWFRLFIDRDPTAESVIP